jgi:hypothetical protein
MSIDPKTIEPGTIIRHKTQSGRTARVIGFDDGYYIVRSMRSDGGQGAVLEAHPAMWEPVPPEPRYLREGDVAYTGWKIIDMIHSESVGWVAITQPLGGQLWRRWSAIIQEQSPDGVTVDGVVLPWPPAPEAVESSTDLRDAIASVLAQRTGWKDIDDCRRSPGAWRHWTLAADAVLAVLRERDVLRRLNAVEVWAENDRLRAEVEELRALLTEARTALIRIPGGDRLLARIYDALGEDA